MAKPKVDIMVTHLSKATYSIIFYCEEGLVADVQSIEGIRWVMTSDGKTGPHFAFYDPRYDADEIVREMEVLSVPLPESVEDLLDELEG